MWRRAPTIGEEELQGTALRILLDRGLHALTADAVAAFFSVPTATITALEPRFPQFAAEVLRRVVATELAEVKRSVLMHPAPMDQLRAFVAMLADPIRVESTAAWIEAFSLSRRDAHLASVVRAEQESWQRFAAGIVQRGIRAGVWATDDPQAVATHLLAMIDGLNSYALIRFEPGMERRRMLERVVHLELGVRLTAATSAEDRSVTFG